MEQWKYLVLIICLLAVCFLIWKEAKRANKARLAWRLLASVAAVCCLYFLALPPTINANIDNNHEEAIILTDGFSNDSVSTFLQHKKNIPIYHFSDYVNKGQSSHKTLHVFGDGLSMNEWSQLNGSSVTFHPSPEPFGITSASWNKQLQAGSMLTIQGKFNNASHDSIKIFLEGFGEILDSVLIESSHLQPFQLTTTPVQMGKAVFYIKFVQGKDTIRQPVPFEVIQSGPMRVLMLASSPNFETRFLSNWLFKNGYTVVMRTAISKNKYQQSFLDTGRLNTTSITPELLDNFDVLISDEHELNSLSSNENNVIKQQIAERGVGLIVATDTVPEKNSFYNQRFSFVVSSNHNKQSVPLHVDDVIMPVLPMDQPVYIKNGDLIQGLVTDRSNNIFSAVSLYGSGKIICTTVPNSYNWLLSGNEKSYASFWSSLLEKVVRQKVSSSVYTINNFPFLNEAVNINAVAPATPSQFYNNSYISWHQTPFMPFAWQGTYWPLKAGWQNVSDGYSWYAFDSSDWKNIQRHKKIMESYEYLASFKNKSLYVSGVATKEKHSFPVIYFWVIFLICCMYLWIENKL